VEIKGEVLPTLIFKVWVEGWNLFPSSSAQEQHPHPPKYGWTVEPNMISNIKIDD
jgi:hypothetical protein